jgi:hypothetical protein
MCVCVYPARREQLSGETADRESPHLAEGEYVVDDQLLCARPGLDIAVAVEYLVPAVPGEDIALHVEEPGVAVEGGEQVPVGADVLEPGVSGGIIPPTRDVSKRILCLRARIMV